MRCLTLLIVVLIALTGCITPPKPDPNYEAYARILDKQAADEQARYASLGAAAAACKSDACVERVSSSLAIVIAASGGGGSRIQPQQFRKQHHPAWGIVAAVAPQLVPGYVSVRQSDNATEIALGQYGFLGSVIRDVSQSPALRSPSITVAGDYVPGTQHIGDAVAGDYITGHVGDAVGRDNIAGDQHVGDAVGRDAIGRDQHIGDAIGRDNIGRDRNTDSNIGNDNRQDSAGPFDNDIDNGNCNRSTGVGCQGEGLPITEPDPVDPGGPIVGPPPGG